MSRAVITGCVVATLAFAAYTRTLLPGVDFGDTGGFQAAVLWPEISARQAYPLYYAIARPFVAALSPDAPARGLNLFSALWAAVAAGALTGVVAAVTGSLAGGAVAGLLLAFSYTFWTQAVIAEVYSLHLALVGFCLAALVAWWRRPSTLRLGLFFSVYAISFGNHLSMILLLLPFAAFLLADTERRRDLLSPHIVALAIGTAAAGALQYVPQLIAVWTAIDAPERWTDRLAAFWFDVSKADWRESMVLGVGISQLADRLRMFVFDARQQFGLAGIAFAAAGAVCLCRTSRPWAVLVVTAYAINTVFALTYNVGDPHVFYLPGHYFTAFAAGVAVAAAGRLARPAAAFSILAVAAVMYAAWRAYDTWPAIDRHEDRRAEQVVSRMTFGLDDRTTLLAAELNWQVENALLYATRYRERHVVWTRLADVMLHFPLLVRDNHAGGRDVVLTAAAVPHVAAAFGSLLPMVPDGLPPAPSLAGHVGRMPRGTPYVLTILAPPRDEALDEDLLHGALVALTGGQITRHRGAPYEILVGRSGETPLLHIADAKPFRRGLDLPEGKLDIRMDGWVPLETFRRGGFGHVTLNRRPLLIVERGVSLAALDTAEPFYASGIYASQPRFRIPSSGIPELALLH